MWSEYVLCSQIGAIKFKYDQIRLNLGKYMEIKPSRGKYRYGHKWYIGAK